MNTRFSPAAPLRGERVRAESAIAHKTPSSSLRFRLFTQQYALRLNMS
jgi:hypothetical protein